MGVRRGRLLPSVMIGGVLATGMAFGVGTASAAVATCKGVDDVTYSILASAKVTADGTKCTDPVTGSELTADELKVLKAADALGTYVAPTTEPSVPAPVTTSPVVPTSPKPTTTTSAAPTPVASPTPAAPAPAAAPAPVAAAAAAPVVLPADKALNGSLLTVDPTALGGAPVASSFFGLGTYNPGLLLAAPFGSPLRNLANTDPASAVTTASQVQAMAFDGLPEGVGIPAVLGVLILAGLGGVAVRHRILSGARAVDTDEDRTEA